MISGADRIAIARRRSINRKLLKIGERWPGEFRMIDILNNELHDAINGLEGMIKHEKGKQSRD